MQNVDAVLGVHIQIRHIKAFLAVAEELHFCKAASRLNIAQPALSRTIQHLERMLGVQLLERTTRSVQLTGAGRSFCEHGAKILAVKCAQRTSDGNSGRLAVGYVDFALAGPVSHVFGKFKRSLSECRDRAHSRIAGALDPAPDRQTHRLRLLARASAQRQSRHPLRPVGAAGRGHAGFTPPRPALED
jgi:DNA-binding transcriptional LysR family regulator